MKGIKFPVVVSFTSTPKQRETDIYEQKAFKKIGDDVSSIMGVIDARLIEWHTSETKYLYSLIESLIVNLFMRTGMFVIDKETYLKKLEIIYDKNQEYISKNVFDIEGPDHRADR